MVIALIAAGLAMVAAFCIALARKAHGRWQPILLVSCAFCAFGSGAAVGLFLSTDARPWTWSMTAASLLVWLVACLAGFWSGSRYVAARLRPRWECTSRMPG